MDLQFLRFYELFGVLVVVWLYGFSSLFTGAWPAGKRQTERLIFKTDLILY